MYASTTQGDKTMPYVHEIVADKESDLQAIDTKTLAPGSVCIVIETSNVYMLNTEKIWKTL